VADVFSKTFVREHAKEFDAVLVLDCGGEWYRVPNEFKDEHEVVAALASLGARYAKLLVPSETLVLGKILHDKVSSLLIQSLESRGFAVDAEVGALGHRRLLFIWRAKGVRRSSPRRSGSRSSSPSGGVGRKGRVNDVLSFPAEAVSRLARQAFSPSRLPLPCSRGGGRCARRSRPMTRMFGASRRKSSADALGQSLGVRFEC